MTTSALRYPRPAIVTPAHPHTWAALYQMRSEAEYLAPQDHPKVRAIKDAYEAGDLYEMVEAVKAACALRDPLNGVVASTVWVRRAKEWMVLVRQNILIAEVAA